MILKSFNRWQAFFVHLGLSVLLAGLVIGLVAFVWYPKPYFTAMGGGMLLQLIIGVDVVVGPLITLIIFDTRKPRLKLDLAIIGVLQVAALVYGTAVMFQARPAWNVFVKDRFEVVAANDIDAEARERAKEPFRTVPMTGPVMVAGRLPADPKASSDLALTTMMGGADVAARPDLFVPLAEEAQAIARVSRPLQALSRKSEASAGLVSAFAAERGAGRELGYLPVRARNQDFSAVVDRKSGEVVGYLPIDPW